MYDIHDIQIKKDKIEVKFLDNSIERLKVGIIDSGIDLNNPFFEGHSIESYSYENDNFVKCYSDNTNGNSHGTEVASFILNECSYIDLLSIKILNDSNKSSQYKLIKAIKFCIEKKVNIINLSLGVVADIEKCTELKKICIEAYNRGIFIFSAENNHGLISYPCNFSTVVKITSFNSPCSSELLILDKNDKSLNFSHSFRSLSHLNINELADGNSFLCPCVVGVFCRFLYYSNISLSTSYDVESIINDFFNFYEILFTTYNDKIFNIIDDTLKKENATFFRYSTDNIQVLKSFIHIYNIKCYYDTKKTENPPPTFPLFTKLKEIIDNNVFIVGKLPFTKHNKNELINLFLTLSNKNINFILRNSILNTFDRFLLCKYFSVNVNCMFI